MKNQVLYIALLLLAFFTFFTFSNCSNESPLNSEKTVLKNSIININLKTEVEKLVDLQCKAINVLRKVTKGDRNALNRSNSYRKEADKIARDLQNKYSSPNEQENFSKAYQEALVNCPYVK